MDMQTALANLEQVAIKYDCHKDETNMVDLLKNLIGLAPGFPDGQKWQTGIPLLQEDPLPTSARQFEEAKRILKTQYDLFQQQTEAGKFNETLEQRLADALIAATSCMGVPDVDDVIAKPFNYDTPVLEVCAYMHQVCCAAVAYHSPSAPQ